VETRVVAESILPQPLGRRWYPLGDLLFLVDGHYDPSAGTLRSDYTIIKGGEREEKSAVYAVYTFREVQRLAEAAGFAVVGAYGSLAREPFRLGSPGLWLVAEAV
jgi:hypothetical protein